MTADHMTGSLDRCVDGETARTILSNTPEVPPTPSQSGGVPLQVRTVSVSPQDSSIQVCVVGGCEGQFIALKIYVCGGKFTNYYVVKWNYIRSLF